MYDIEPLRAAIIKRAVIDYKTAIATRNFYTMASLERFFLSDYGQLLSYYHGEYIIDRCKGKVKN